MYGYESLVWVNDKDGQEFVCSLDNNRENPKSFNDLSEHEKRSCRNVNEIVGTERW